MGWRGSVLHGDRFGGPVFGITAAAHGNELNGIQVIHALFEHLDPRALVGTVVGVAAVNVPGLHNHQREFVDGHDLNHIFPGHATGNVAEIFAHRIMQRIIRRFDYLVDLHTASFGRVNSLYVRADMTHPQCARMAYLQRPQIIVHNPPRDRTLRGAAMNRHIPAITVEIGVPQRFQPSYIKSSRVGLRSVLADARMLPRRNVKLGDEPVICERSYWLYTDRGGSPRCEFRLPATVASRADSKTRLDVTTATLIMALGVGCSPPDAPRGPADRTSDEAPVVDVGRSAVAVREGEMTVPELLEEASIDDTPGNRAVLEVCERYRRAVEARDVARVLELASASYLDDSGTADPADDVDYAALSASLGATLRATSKVDYVFRYLSITWSGDIARVDYRYAATFRHRDRVQQLNERNQLELIRKGTSFKILSGM